MIDKELKVSKSIEINTSKERVWEVLTNPELIAKYLHGTKTITDWKEGSRIIFQGEYEGHKYKDKGNVLSIKPFEVIKYNYWSSFSETEDRQENYSDIALLIEKLDEKRVHFTWRQEGFANAEGYKHSQEGLQELIEKIKEIAETYDL
jgi:uncharacterized protein YndB with AHSA1/START domain